MRIAITSGDPNGIGPEVVLKAVNMLDSDRMQPVLVGSERVFQLTAQKVGLTPFQYPSVSEIPAGPQDTPSSGLSPFVLRVNNGEVTPVYGKITPEAGRLAWKAIDRAIDLCRTGAVDAMVTAPISKEAVAAAGFDFPGHTEYIAHRTEASRHLMLMVSEAASVGLVTTHVPLQDVSSELSVALIREKLDVLLACLRSDFGLDSPRIAVLGLNPHAGDGGVIGSEEEEIVQPVLTGAEALDAKVDGPFAADAFFGRGVYRRYDAVLALYHDQGLIPFKILAQGKGVNVTAGLPIVRTSPDHGTAFDIAGKGEASAESMGEAIRLAGEIAEQRFRTS